MFNVVNNSHENMCLKFHVFNFCYLTEQLLLLKILQITVCSPLAIINKYIQHIYLLFRTYIYLGVLIIMYIGSYICQLSVKLLWQYLACESYCCCMTVKDHLKELDIAACVSRCEGLSLCEDDHKATHVIVCCKV